MPDETSVTPVVPIIPARPGFPVRSTPPSQARPHRLWKCYNCQPTTGPQGIDFEDDSPVCPTCGLDARTDGVHHIIPRVAVHFDPPHPKINGKGTNFAACDGRPIMGRAGSGDPAAVSCPACQESPQFVAAGGRVSGTVNEVNNIKFGG